jgi:SNF2 family DNA or RNA helicase
MSNSLNLPLFEHQQKCIDWMENIEKNHTTETLSSPGGIITMKMGLGKTAVALGLIEQNNQGYPTLVVCPKAALTTWQEEIKKFLGDDYKYLWLSTTYLKKNKNKINVEHLEQYNIVLINFELMTAQVNAIREQERNVYVAPIQLRDGTYFVNSFSGFTTSQITAEGVNIDPVYNPASACGIKALFAMKWHRIIADESQNFCNPETNLFRTICALVGERKWCLTGTPIRNTLNDLYSQLTFIGYKKPLYNLKSHEERDRIKKYIWEETYQTAQQELPVCNVNTVPCMLDEKSIVVYKFFKTQAIEYMKQYNAGRLRFANLLTSFMRLRQICDAPFLITPGGKELVKEGYDPDVQLLGVDDEEEKGSGMTAQEQAKEVANLNQKMKDTLNKETFSWLHTRNETAGIYSFKLDQVMTLILDIIQKSPNDKIILFSNFTSCLNLIEQRLKLYCAYERIDGSMTTSKRAKRLENFRMLPDYKVLMMTYKVGAESLNLTEANHMILVDCWWTNAVIDQAIARIHRTGQKKECHVYQLHAAVAPPASSSSDKEEKQPEVIVIDDDKEEKDVEEPPKKRRRTAKATSKKPNANQDNQDKDKPLTHTIEDRMLEICNYKTEKTKDWFALPVYNKTKISKRQTGLNANMIQTLLQ